MITLDSIRTRALALRSSVHNEHQLSSIELAAMTAKKTNEIIDVIDDLYNLIESIAKANGLMFIYNPDTESIEIGVKE